MSLSALDQITVPDTLPECQKLAGDLIGLCKELLKTVAEQNEKIEALQHRVDTLIRAQYGRSSESTKSNGQLGLFNLQAETEEPEENSESSQTVAKQPAKGHGRRRPSNLLPRRRIVHELSAEERCCPGCGVERPVVGEETSERLAYYPALVQVIEEVRLKYACKKCAEYCATAAAPAKPIPKGLADSTMLAYIATSKFADHIPLHRLEGIFRRHGAEIARSTMCDWLASTADLLLPIYEKMKERVLNSRIIWTDDTPADMQDRTHENNIRQARVWIYLGDNQNKLAVFDFTDSRKRDGPAAFLGNFSGYLQADAYAGYDHIYATNRVKEVACWAHARRKFFDALKSNRRFADAAMRHIRVLYKVEAKAEPLSSDEKLRLRKRFSAKVLAIFKRWLDTNSIAALPKSPLGKAINYALNNWSALTTYVEDPDLTPDNNKAENALRTIAIGRNYVRLPVMSA